MILVTTNKVKIEVSETPAGGRIMRVYCPVKKKIFRRYTHPSRATSLKRFLYDVDVLENALNGKVANGVLS
ncbi:MAG: hypothetical protein EKK57_09725 [Proteobacteria bacterium]|nr:MAG: hypothetical protein EKK57_09725 [Pseudomonadota bacterium]